MNNTLLIFGIVFLIGIGLVIYKYNHRKALHDNVDQLKDVTAIIFKEAGKDVISRNKYLHGLKLNMGVNEKQALNMFAKARKENLIKVNGTEVEQA